jgi:hypothetical protein
MTGIYEFDIASDRVPITDVKLYQNRTAIRLRMSPSQQRNVRVKQSASQF